MPAAESADLSRPLADADIEALNDYLTGLPEELEPLDVAMLDGYLVGILLQPQTPDPSDWLPPIFDSQSRATGWPDDVAAQVTSLIMRRYHELAACINAREEFDPIVFDLDDDQGQAVEGEAAIAVLEPWVAGMMCAFDAFPEGLDAIDADDEAASALSGLLRHLPLDPEDTSEDARELVRERAELDREMPLHDLSEAIDDLVSCVLTIASITRPLRPVERDAPKTGRNDPCPCGSGKKYKLCHGRDLH